MQEDGFCEQCPNGMNFALLPRRGAELAPLAGEGAQMVFLAVVVTGVGELPLEIAAVYILAQSCSLA